jgi:hypothetical protein
MRPFLFAPAVVETSLPDVTSDSRSLKAGPFPTLAPFIARPLGAVQGKNGRLVTSCHRIGEKGPERPGKAARIPGSTGTEGPTKHERAASAESPDLFLPHGSRRSRPGGRNVTQVSQVVTLSLGQLGQAPRTVGRGRRGHCGHIGRRLGRSDADDADMADISDGASDGRTRTTRTLRTYRTAPRTVGRGRRGHVGHLGRRLGRSDADDADISDISDGASDGRTRDPGAKQDRDERQSNMVALTGDHV